MTTMLQRRDLRGRDTRRQRPSVTDASTGDWYLIGADGHFRPD